MQNIDEIAKIGLNLDLYRALVRLFGKRGEKAFRYIVERRVKKYRDFFVVVGREEYIVDEDFCTCKDFQINLKCEGLCAHILAVKIAKRLNVYDYIDAYYVDFLGVER